MATQKQPPVVETAPPDPMLPRRFRVIRHKRENSDTFSVELKPVEGPRRFDFKPGQFNMLYIFGVGEIPISISGDPGRPEEIVHTTRAVGTVTRAMKRLQPGDTIGVRGPFGRGWPVEKAEGGDVVLVAGGIGLAPLRPVMHHLVARRERFGKIVLLHGCRTPGDMIYRREIQKWRSRLDLEVHITVDRPTIAWRGNVGLVTALIAKAPFDPLKSTAMVCGPEIMMRFTLLELEARGVAPGRIHLSMERNMKCGIGHCGHCQVGPFFVCKDGPVFRWETIKEIFTRGEG